MAPSPIHEMPPIDPMRKRIRELWEERGLAWPSYITLHDGTSYVYAIIQTLTDTWFEFRDGTDEVHRVNYADVAEAG